MRYPGTKPPLSSLLFLRRPRQAWSADSARLLPVCVRRLLQPGEVQRRRGGPQLLREVRDSPNAGEAPELVVDQHRRLLGPSLPEQAVGEWAHRAGHVEEVVRPHEAGQRRAEVGLGLREPSHPAERIASADLAPGLQHAVARFLPSPDALRGQGSGPLELAHLQEQVAGHPGDCAPVTYVPQS